MHIFVDESGNFSATPNPGAFSLVAACVFSEAQMKPASEALRRFKVGNGFRHSDEVKRWKVSDAGYFEFLADLASLKPFVLGVATNASLNPSAERHQKQQVALIREVKGTMAHKSGAEFVEAKARSIEKLPVQHWVEIVCRCQLVLKVIQTSMLYFATRTPATLGTFRWNFDAKGSDRNRFDETFQSVALPLLQGEVIKNPLIERSDGDYRHFARFYSNEPWPEGLPPPASVARQGNVVRASRIWEEHLAFPDSKASNGVQIVDLIASGLRGCLRGDFADNERAAALLGGLMLHREGHRPLDVMTVGADTPGMLPPDVRQRLNHMQQSARRV